MTLNNLIALCTFELFLLINAEVNYSRKGQTWINTEDWELIEFFTEIPRVWIIVSIDTLN